MCKKALAVRKSFMMLMSSFSSLDFETQLNGRTVGELHEQALQNTEHGFHRNPCDPDLHVKETNIDPTANTCILQIRQTNIQYKKLSQRSKHTTNNQTHDTKQLHYTYEGLHLGQPRADPWADWGLTQAVPGLTQSEKNPQKRLDPICFDDCAK